MYEYLEKYGVSKNVIEAMNKVDRKVFVPSEYVESAYLDIPLPIGYGQTISAPHMVGLMCEYLKIQEGEKILEIGTGSGYNAAVMSFLVGESGHIYSIERIPQLAQRAISRMSELGISNVSIFVGDGKKGLKEHSPFDKISVTCYAKKIPEELVKQLKETGTMIIPIGNEYVQMLTRISKIDGELKTENLGFVRFVPLV